MSTLLVNYHVYHTNWNIALIIILAERIVFFFLVGWQRDLVILHDLDGLLLVPNYVAILRYQAKRLLADVCASHSDFATAVSQLDLQFASRRILGASDPRLCWYLLGGSQNYQIRKLPKDVRLYFRPVHRGLDRDSIGMLPASNLQHICRGSTYSTHVPGLLHFQLVADCTIVLARCLDIHDSPNRP